MEGGVFDRVPVAGIVGIANGTQCRSRDVGDHSLAIGLMHPPRHLFRASEGT